MNTLKAIFFDLDGTLADSMLVMRNAYNLFMRSLDRNPTEEEFLSLNGPPITEFIKYLKTRHLIAEPYGSLIKRYSDTIDEVYKEVKPNKGVKELLHQAKDNDCIIGVVTSNSNKRTLNWLKNHLLFSLIDFIISEESVKIGKPNPEPYIQALGASSLKPSQAIAVEDSLQGAEAALEAGLKTYVLLHEFNRNYTWPNSVIKIESLTLLNNLFI